MKNLSRFAALLALTAFAFAPCYLRAQDAPPPPDQQQYAPPDQGAPDQGDGDDGTSFQTFYDQLGSQGQWIQTDNYGYVFQPNVSDPDWAPYTDGHWVYTDVGWTWVSDEPWGWATYHYGRWANIDGTGWVWVPGYRWAPAWVSWRYGGGYAGWAPLPPETFVGAEYGGGGDVGIGFHFGNDVDVNFNIGPGCYNFVNVGDLGESNYRGHYLDHRRNYEVINNTTNITNINVNHTTVNNYYGSGAAAGASRFRGVTTGGPSLTDVNAHAHNRVPTVQLAAANQPGRSALQGNSLAVYAPHMNPSSQHTARPAQVSQTIAHPAFNRGDSITRPLAVTSSIKPAAPSAEAVAAAQAARQHAPATARIATENTHVKTQITQPLSAMQPIEQTHHTATSTPKPASPGASSAFTGENAKPAVNTHPQSVEPTQTYHPQAQSQSPQVYHPQTEAKPESTYHPQAQTQSPQVYHPQTEDTHTPVSHPQAQSESGQVYHPQTQSQFQPTQTYHPQTQPAPTFHPQTETAPTFHPQTQAAPAQATHPQAEPQHEAQHEVQHQAPAHPQAAPAAAPAAKPAAAAPAAGGNKNDQPGH